MDGARTKRLYLPQGRLCAGLAAAARIDHSEKHRSPTRNTPQPRAFRGTDAKEFPILSAANDSSRLSLNHSVIGWSSNTRFQSLASVAPGSPIFGSSRVRR